MLCLGDSRLALFARFDAGARSGVANHNFFVLCSNCAKLRHFFRKYFHAILTEFVHGPTGVSGIVIDFAIFGTADHFEACSHLVKTNVLSLLVARKNEEPLIRIRRECEDHNVEFGEFDGFLDGRGIVQVVCRLWNDDSRLFDCGGN